MSTGPNHRRGHGRIQDSTPNPSQKTGRTRPLRSQRRLRVPRCRESCCLRFGFSRMIQMPIRLEDGRLLWFGGRQPGISMSDRARSDDERETRVVVDDPPDRWNWKIIGLDMSYETPF